jgi:hypothetical protein
MSIGGRTSTSVGLATPNSMGLAVRNVGRGRIGLDCDDPRLRGDRCRAHHWAMGPSISLDKSWSTKRRYRIRRSASLNRKSKAAASKASYRSALARLTAPAAGMGPISRSKQPRLDRPPSYARWVGRMHRNPKKESPHVLSSRNPVIAPPTRFHHRPRPTTA